MFKTLVSVLALVACALAFYDAQWIQFDAEDGLLQASLIPTPGTSCMFGQMCVAQLDARLEVYADYVRFRINDLDHPKNPLMGTVFPADKPFGDRVAVKDSMFDISYTTQPFGVRVMRKIDGTVIFDSTADAVFADLQYVDGTPLNLPNEQFLQIGSKGFGVNSEAIGFGEQALGDGTRSVLPRNSNFTLWPQAVFGAANRNSGVYGMHPIMYFVNTEMPTHGFEIEKSGHAHALFSLTSRPTELEYTSEGDLIFRQSGGQFDMVMIGGHTNSKDYTMAGVLMAYLNLIGTPYLAPLWSYGHGLSQWGIPTLQDLKAITEAHEAAGVPFDHVWNDIDIFYKTQNLVLSQEYPADEMQTFVKGLHEAKRAYVPMAEPFLPVEGSTEAADRYHEGVKVGAFIKNEDSPAVYRMLGTNNSYVDFTCDAGAIFWRSEVLRFITTAFGSVDGLWLDQNEPTTDCHGSDCSESAVSKGNPTFVPSGRDLEALSLPFNSSLAAGALPDVKGLYPVLQCETAQDALKAVNPKNDPYRLGAQGLVLSRSTFPGSGRFASHWTGDNNSTVLSLADSVSQVTRGSLYGLGQVGADVAGFAGSKHTDDKLVARFYQAGVFAPFLRNHISMGRDTHFITDLGAEAADAAKAALLLRYTMIPTTYGKAVAVHRGDAPCAYCVPEVHFTSDATLLTTMGNSRSTRVLATVGSEILVAPILDEAKSRDVYLPHGPAMWYRHGGVQSLDAGASHHFASENLGADPIHSVPFAVAGGSGIYVVDNAAFSEEPMPFKTITEAFESAWQLRLYSNGASAVAQNPIVARYPVVLHDESTETMNATIYFPLINSATPASLSSIVLMFPKVQSEDSVVSAVLEGSEVVEIESVKMVNDAHHTGSSVSIKFSNAVSLDKLSAATIRVTSVITPAVEPKSHHYALIFGGVAVVVVIAVVALVITKRKSSVVAQYDLIADADEEPVAPEAEA